MATKTGKGDRVRSAKNRSPSAWPVFLIAHDALVELIEERLCEAGLPEIAWYTVLWVLDRAPSNRLRMHELADAAVISRPNLTRLVDRMEKAGLVMRVRDPQDRRGAFAALSPAGHDMKERIWEVYAPAIDEVFARHLSGTENAMLYDIMVRLYERSKSGG